MRAHYSIPSNVWGIESWMHYQPTFPWGLSQDFAKQKVAKVKEIKHEPGVLGFGALGFQSTEVVENQNVKFTPANMPTK